MGDGNGRCRSVFVAAATDIVFITTPVHAGRTRRVINILGRTRSLRFLVGGRRQWRRCACDIAVGSRKPGLAHTLAVGEEPDAPKTGSAARVVEGANLGDEMVDVLAPDKERVLEHGGPPKIHRPYGINTRTQGRAAVESNTRERWQRQIFNVDTIVYAAPAMGRLKCIDHGWYLYLGLDGGRRGPQDPRGLGLCPLVEQNRKQYKPAREH